MTYNKTQQSIFAISCLLNVCSSCIEFYIPEIFGCEHIKANKEHFRQRMKSWKLSKLQIYFFKLDDTQDNWKVGNVIRQAN